MIRFSRLAFVAPLVLVCTTAAAQTVPGARSAPLPTVPGALRVDPAWVLETATVRDLSAVQSLNQPARRDSLWNGTLVGAGLGALLGIGAGLAWIECPECAGFNVPLTFAVLGAGAGAGIGAGIDALHSRRGAVSPRQRTVQVSPLITGRSRGLLAWIRF